MVIPTPIDALDTYSLWIYSGTLRSTISGSTTGINIHWEQLTGDPVTFTSPIDQLDVTFTSSNLLNKTFRVYTNKGSAFEEYDDCTFYHHPIDIVRVDYGGYSNTRLTNHFYQTAIKVTAIPGMYPVNNSLPRYGIVPKTSDKLHGFKVLDLNTEIVLTGVPSGYTQITTKIEVESSPGVWTTFATSDAGESTIIGLTQVPRLKYSYVYRGLRSSVEISDSVIMNAIDVGCGASNPVMSGLCRSNTMTNYLSTPHTMVEYNLDDTVTTELINGNVLSNFLSISHVFGIINLTNETQTEYNTVTDITNYLSTPHTSTSVGGG